jgi:S1-C subfamily serine protease
MVRSANGTPVQSLVSGRGHTWEARIVGLAPEFDLALLQVEAKGLSALPIANYDQLRQGEIVFAFGNPWVTEFGDDGGVRRGRAPDGSRRSPGVHSDRRPH